MSLKNIPPCPPTLKPIQHYLKTAVEHDERDLVVAYWCRVFALELGLKTDRSSQEAKRLLGSLMEWLENTKAAQKDNEAIAHDIPAQAHLENYALKLFLWADSQDRAGIFNKNVVKAFYTAGMIYDVLDTFGEPSEEVQQNKKYAKWKAAYIHNCLKNGETPVPGPMTNEEDNLNEPSSSNVLPPAPGFGMPQPPDFGVPPSSGPPYPTSGGNNSSSFILPQPPTPAANPEPKSEPLNPAELLDFTNPSAVTTDKSSSGKKLTPEQITQAQKFCKFASSALNYDDIPTAEMYLQKALQLIQTGSNN